MSQTKNSDEDKQLYHLTQCCDVPGKYSYRVQNLVRVRKPVLVWVQKTESEINTDGLTENYPSLHLTFPLIQHPSLYPPLLLLILITPLPPYHSSYSSSSSFLPLIKTSRNVFYRYHFQDFHRIFLTSSPHDKLRKECHVLKLNAK